MDRSEFQACLKGDAGGGWGRTPPSPQILALPLLLSPQIFGPMYNLPLQIFRPFNMLPLAVLSSLPEVVVVTPGLDVTALPVVV